MISSKVGKQISQIRESKGWTKKQLSSYADISTTYIGELEIGKKNPTIVVLEKIAKALGVSISELLQEESA